MNHILRMGGAVAALAMVTLLVGLAGPAAAFQQADQDRNYEITLPAFDLEGYQSPATADGRLQVAETLKARYAGNWHIQSWNPQTSMARWVYGPSVQVAAPLYASEDVEIAARQVITANQDVLKADPTELRLTGVEHAVGKWAAHFQQTWHGIDVHGATVRIIFSEDGRLMLMGSDYQPAIDLSPVPLYSEIQAIQIAKNGVAFNPSTDTVQDGVKLLVLPVSLSQTQVEYHLVWQVRVRTEDPVGIWVTHVDAHNGQVIWRYNDVHFAYSGTSTSPVHLNSYCDGTVNRVCQYLRVQVTGVGNVNTDANGNWTIAGTGGPRTVTADLYGPYVDLNNIAGAEGTFTGTAQEDIPLSVAFSDANAQKDERDTFDAVNQIHEFFGLFAPDFSYTNARITANVSRNSTCNAYWDGTINFYIAGGGCANTGEMQQVVEHEFGHGIQNAILGGQGNEGLGEGNGDIIGNLMTQDPIIGRGFYTNNCVSGIRNSLNTLRYPGDVVGQEIHYAGQVIAGFNWDMMVGLQAVYGTEQGKVKAATIWHYGRVLLHPQTQSDQVLSAFTADDDNGNLDDGTPNYDAICQAATNHGFNCPEIVVGVFITHSTAPYSGDRTVGYTLTATIVSLPAGNATVIPSSAFLHYRVNGGIFQNLQMTPTGNPDEYRVVLPAQAYGSIVEYYLSASDTDSNNGTSPRDYPANVHYFQVNDTFSDEMESVTAWKSGYTGDTASSGYWIEADPIGTVYNSVPVQPENDHTADPGHICWITGNGTVGGAAGEADVDGGKTTLLSPRFDLTGASQVQVSYWKFYTNSVGNNPNADTWYVDVTNNGGQTWTPIENTMTSTNAWVQQGPFDLMPYVPTPGVVQFRFVAEDLSPGSLIEAGIDDFLLAAIFNTADAGDFSVRFLTRLEQNTPNPFGLSTDIRFRLAEAGDVSLAVYDGTGRRVRSLAGGSMGAGDHDVRWDGTDDSGRTVAAGVYFCRLQAGGKSHSARMLLVR